MKNRVWSLNWMEKIVVYKKLFHLKNIRVPEIASTKYENLEKRN